MTDHEHQHLHPAPRRPAASKAWAPWWIYLMVLLGANYLRIYLLSGSGLSVPVGAIIAIVQAAILFVLVTAIWRTTRRGDV